MATLRLTNPDEVRATIAAHVLGAASGGGTIGTVTLHAHQAAAVSRLREIIRRHGGALLADEVGLGKTFVALALASELGEAAVVAPASLRPMWRDAAARAGLTIRFVSMEMLGHGATVPTSDFIIVDEAHHFRNPGTNRYGNLAACCALRPVLLISATPVQNSVDDLRHLAALILGLRAADMSVAELGSLIVRRRAMSVSLDARLPALDEPRRVAIAGDVDCLDQICGLSTPVPPADGGVAETLMVFSLTRQWASSRAALAAALTRRLAAARAMEDALSSGRHVSRDELAAWRFADGVQQLCFVELVSQQTGAGPELLDQVRRHADDLRHLLAFLRQQPDVDADRAAQLSAIATRHSGERIVAFAEFTETVASLYRRLAATHRVAMLTHGGGRVAGGPITRADVLTQFGGGSPASEPARIDLLLTTDMFSEGVNLQGASVVVHLDLSWNPARMEQRVGRLRRPGAARDRVASYVFAPPAPTERLLQLDRRLRSKMGEASRTVGVTGSILPGFVTSTSSVMETREGALAVLRGWLRPGSRSDPVLSGIAMNIPGALACVRRAGEVTLAIVVDGRVSLDPSADLLTSVGVAAPAPFPDAAAASALRTLTNWVSRGELTQVVELPGSGVARSRRAILTRVNGIVRRARRHERTSLSAMLGAARRAATIAMPVGAERVLDQLARAPLADEAWLRAVGEFGAIHGRASGHADEVLALLVFVGG
jgi:hypothetical protein